MSMLQGRASLSVLVVASAAVLLSADGSGGGVAVSDVVMPGGVAAAHAVLRDRTSPSRALFLAEFIERFYNTPKQIGGNADPVLHGFLSHLEQAAVTGGASDTVPLPLTVEWWNDVVFDGHTTPDRLVLDILRSRDAALMYRGLLALDAPTRSWIADQHALVSALLDGRAALLVVAAPGVRIRDGRLSVPGGERARHAWEVLVGAATTEPAVFLQRLIEQDDGGLAYFFGRTAYLSDAQVAALLGTGPHDLEREANALKRVYRVFRRVGERWHPASRPFSAMPDDPSMLLSELPVDDQGRLLVPGGRGFWEAVFDAHGNPSKLSLRDDAGLELDAGADVPWLVERVFDGEPPERRLRAEQVLFAARSFRSPRHVAAADAAVTLVALGWYPALVRTLERMGDIDAAACRQAVERAEALQEIRTPGARVTAIAQFQGALALVASTATGASLTTGATARLVSSLASVPTTPDGAYDGALATWIDAHLRSGGVRDPRQITGQIDPWPGGDPAIEDDLLAALASAASGPAATFEWEGTRYRLDLAFAAARRLEFVRGDGPPRDLSSAWSLHALADRLDHGSLTPGELSRASRWLDELARRGDGWSAEARDDAWSATSKTIARGLRPKTPADRRAIAGPMRKLADVFVASGLAELAYAAALGGSEARPITASDAAGRHDFGLDRADALGAPTAWELPRPAARARGPWHVEGSLLSLDLALTESWLIRTSSRPLEAAPMMDRMDRRVLGEVVRLMNPAALTDADRDFVAWSVRAGRARIAAAVAAGDLDMAVEVLPLDAVRRHTLPWMFRHERDRVAGAFSISELFRLGSGDVSPRFDAWGAPAWPRLGCLCLQFPVRARDAYTGHLSSGILMSALPDLQLRLAEWLSDLRVPVALLPALLAPATLELVDRAPVRYADDARSLVEQVNAVTLDDVERYLALLTTDGPLVPVGETTSAARSLR